MIFNRTSIQRSTLHASVAGLVAFALSITLGVVNAAALASCDPAARKHLKTVAPNVLVWEGGAQEVSRDNGGRVSSSVVFFNASSVTVLDPGPSRSEARRLRAAIACIASAHPITKVLNSHAHAENVLGNSAFTRAKVYASATTRENMRTRCLDCLASMKQRVGRDKLAGTEIRLPDGAIAFSKPMRLAQSDWTLIEMRDAHTESDLVLWLPRHQLLIATSLVYAGRVPELAQGSALGWIDALDRLKKFAPRTVVAYRVHQVADGDPFAETRSYLCALVNYAWDGLEAGRLESEISAAPMPAFAQWVGYSQRHPGNVRRVWAELEGRWLRGQRPEACN